MISEIRAYTRELLLNLSADTVVKINAESLVLSKIISSHWTVLAEEFLLEAEPYLMTGVPNRLALKSVLDKNLDKFSKFPGQVIKPFNEYIENAYNYGVEFTARGRTRTQKDMETVIQNIMRVTHTNRSRTVAAMERWFKKTQGQYFERFIVPETNRLIKIMEDWGEETSVTRIRDLGVRYRKFVKAEGYWNAISDYDTATASMFAQIDTLKESGYLTYEIRAVMDDRTCAFCMAINGKTYNVEEGISRKEAMLSMDAEEAAKTYPWPNKSNIESGSFKLPPFHSSCRCWLEGRKVGGGSILPFEISNFREKYKVSRRKTNDSAIAEYISDCLNEKAMNKRCLDMQKTHMTNVALGFRGEKILGDILQVGHNTMFRDPVDWIIEKGELINNKGFAIECKTLRAENVEKKIKMKPDAITRKLTFANEKGLEKLTVAIELAEDGYGKIYYKSGYGGFRTGGMEYIGDVKEAENGITQFSPEVRARILDILKKL